MWQRNLSTLAGIALDENIHQSFRIEIFSDDRISKHKNKASWNTAERSLLLACKALVFLDDLLRERLAQSWEIHALFESRGVPGLDRRGKPVKSNEWRKCEGHPKDYSHQKN